MEFHTPEPRLAVREFETDLVVTGREEAARDVVVLTFEHPDGRPLPEWTPGAHIDLVLEPSFIAGGIGVTPMLPMIQLAEAAGAEWHLLYGGRQRSSMAFVDVLSERGDRVAICPQDETGLLDLDAYLGFPRDDTLVYCCGPEALLGAVQNACASWPAGALHFERFSTKPGVDESTEHLLESFEVVCQRSGITVTVPAAKSVLEVVEGAGVNVLGSCFEGICGSCEVAVLEGTPVHRDSVLTDDEREANEVMMICVSRSCTERLVLDL